MNNIPLNKLDLKELEDEIKKIFNDDLIHKSNNTSSNYEVNGNIIKIKELNENADCKYLCIKFPKNIQHIPFKTEAKNNKRYSLFNVRKDRFWLCRGNRLCKIKGDKTGCSKGGQCEIGLLIKDINSYLVFVELKSTINMSRYCETRNKLKSSFYLIMAILKFFDIEPNYYGLILAYDEDELSVEGLSEEKSENMEIIELDRHATDENYLGYMYIDWTYNRTKKFKIHFHQGNSLLKWEDIKFEFKT